MKAARQTTIRDIATVSGIGVHSGLPVTLSIHPADANYGISFMRTGIEGHGDREVRADVRAVTATEFAKRSAPQGLDAHGRAMPIPHSSEDDQLDIPAFLRRQAT